MNANLIKSATPDDYIRRKNIEKLSESNDSEEIDYLSTETYIIHKNDTLFTDKQYTAECLEQIEKEKDVFQANSNAKVDQYDQFDDNFQTTRSTSSILNIPNVKTVCHDIQPKNNSLDVFSNFNQISKHQTDTETAQYQMAKSTRQLQEREMTDSSFTDQLHINKQSTSLSGNSTIKKSVSKRKSTIPRRRERLEESYNDEKLVEKEVKKYLLKIPSFAPVLHGLPADTSPSDGHSFDNRITSQNKCIGDPDYLLGSKSNLAATTNALKLNEHKTEPILCQTLHKAKEISSQETQKNNSYDLLNNSDSYLQNDSVIKPKSADQGTLMTDVKSKSSKPKGKVVCELCNKSFGRPSELKRHTLLHTGDKPHSCDECQKVFSQRYHLIRHVKNVHKKEIENLVCGVCSETFNSEYLLMRHVKRHGIMTFACEICSKEYKTKRQMKEHVLSLHVGVKPFKCEQCDKVFARKYHLERHVMIHSGIREYQCEYCGKEFCTKGNLLAHVRRVHLKVREFSCGVCDKGFYSPKDLQTHLKKHTGEKPYQCEICLKLFSERVNMEWHLRIHSGERPYQCNNCEKSYTRMPHLIRHQREGLCARRSRIGTWDARIEHDENLVTAELNDETDLNFSFDNSFQDEWNSSKISENSALEMNDSESDSSNEMEYCENGEPYDSNLEMN